MPNSLEANCRSKLRPLTLLQPAKISFGAGASLQAVDFLKERNIASVALFVSRSTCSLAAGLLDALQAAKIETHVSQAQPAEPTLQDAESARAWLRSTAAQAAIGFGGGSVIDIAKIAAATVRQAASLSTFVGNGLLPSRPIPLLAIPTTSGAGSEVSPNAIFLDVEAQLKKGIISPWLVPDAAFVDPELTYSLPSGTTASTALDALSHCIEAYANRNAHPLVDVYALKGVEFIFQNLKAAIEDGRNTEARSALALGSLYGGLCLGPVNTAAIHALSYPLGSEFQVPHGLANAMLMPHVLSFNAVTAPQRYAEIALHLGIASSTDDVTEQAKRFIQSLTQLCADCSIPSSLSDFRVSQDDIPRMAAAALTIQRLLVNNLRDLTQTDAEAIYRNAF
ncbi:iron-containing alcohol dehydrogenase [Pelagicoccus sp. NFK12]|uniref:Iron-containing alcohol dehydrogenase n=1 Tax=Pelagicoccus enzymogenes TaxID=2773457 RepID=A0A927F8G5_9BACT|nr:iron-containing alcohol dehydrogenase [Pelagicoccus enzymogenes]MBD5780398.1 iron-containing alcohol dehydrogenase [Pelagicoccus enzymogenes]